MCKTCGLEWEPEIGMLVAYRATSAVYLIQEKAHRMDFAIRLINTTNGQETIHPRDDMFPIWSQEQLQEMVVNKEWGNYQWHHLGGWYTEWYLNHAIPQWRPAQNWLAFVMHKLHNKHWDGEVWVK